MSPSVALLKCHLSVNLLEIQGKDTESKERQQVTLGIGAHFTRLWVCCASQAPSLVHSVTGKDRLQDKHGESAARSFPLHSDR